MPWYVTTLTTRVTSLPDYEQNRSPERTSRVQSTVVIRYTAWIASQKKCGRSATKSHGLRQSGALSVPISVSTAKAGASRCLSGKFYNSNHSSQTHKKLHVVSRRLWRGFVQDCTRLERQHTARSRVISQDGPHGKSIMTGLRAQRTRCFTSWDYLGPGHRFLLPKSRATCKKVVTLSLPIQHAMDPTREIRR